MPRHFGWESFAFGFGPRGAFWAGPRRRRRQWFESGDMKYVILKLLKDKPRHGYEVMKELEDQLRGCYTPSAGTVYPTLQWLEDEGLVVAKDVEGKKVYEITDAGRKFLDEHRDMVDDIFDRVREAVDRTLGGAMGDVNRSLGRLVKAVYRAGWKARDEATRQRLVAILDRVVSEVEDRYQALPCGLVTRLPAGPIHRLHEPSQRAIHVAHRPAERAVHRLAHAVEDVVHHVAVLVEKLAPRVGDLVDLLSLHVLRDHEPLVLEPLQGRVDRPRRRRIAAVHLVFQLLHHLVAVARLVLH